MTLALGGDVAMIRLVWAYEDGQPVARTEQGDPGAFSLDLSDVESDQLRAVLKAVRPEAT